MELSVKINAAIDGFVSAMKAANGEVQKLVGSTGKPITVNADTEQAKKALNGLQSEIKETQSELGKLGGGGALDGLKKSFAEGREQASSGGGIFGSIASSAGQILSPVGAATAAIGLLGAGLTATFTIGKEFETGLQSVSAVTGVTGAALEDIGNRAQAAAAKYGGSASDQLGVFQTALSKIGPQLAQDADSLSSFSDSVNTLSKTDSALGAAGAVDAISGSLLQFGVNVNDTKEVAREGARFMNVLAASAGVGSASVSQVAETTAKAGASAKNANVSFEEFAATTQVLASKSIVGSEAGTALSAVFTALQKAPGPAAEKLEKLGTSSQKLGELLTTKGVGAAMDEVRKAMSKLGTDAEKNAFTIDLFGQTGANAAQALLSSGEMLKEFTKGVTGTSAGVDQAAVNMATLSEQISRAKAVIENVAIGVYRAIVPMVSSVFTAISETFNKVKDAMMPTLEKLGAAFGAVFQRIQAVVTPILAAIGGFIVTYLVTYWTLVSTAVTAVFSTIVKIFDGIIAAFQPIVTAFKKAFGMDGEAGKSIDVMKIFGNVLTAITGVISFVGEVATELGGLLAEFVIAPMKLGFTVVSLLIQPLVDLGKWIFNVGEKTEETGGFFSTLLDYIKLAPGFIKAVTAGFAAFTNGITDLITNFSFDKLKNLLTGKTVADAFMGSIDKTKFDAQEKIVIEQFQASAKRLSELASKSKTEQEKTEFEQTKTTLLARLKTRLEAGNLTKEHAETLAKDILAINLAGEKKSAEEIAKAQDAAKKDGAKTKMDSLKEEIKKASDENRKLSGEADALQIADELDRAIKANEVKFLAAVDAVQREIEAVKAKKNVSEKERQSLLAILQDRENIILQNGLNQRDEIIRIHNEKQLAEAEKAAAELQKRNAEVDKINAETDKKTAEQDEIRRIARIEDDAERERETRLSEIQKTFTAELLAAAGNERLILDAHRKANAARYDSDEEYNRKTTDLATRTAGVLQGLGMDIATGISEMYGNTFNDLGKAFDDYAAGVQKKMEGTGKEDAAKLEEETKQLRTQLAKREISYQDFQDKIANLRSKEDGGAASATERANLAIGKSFAALGKSATAGVDASIEEMKKLSKSTAQAIKEKGLSDKNVAKDFEKFGKDIVSIGEGTAESVIGVFGQMAAAGTLTLKSAANAALGITIDTISKIVLAQAPAILAIFTGTIPPPFGFIAGIAAIGAVQLLLATAKGAIGADQGVIGIDGNYSTPRSSRDTIPIWVRDGESIINPEATAQNRALLKFINSTNRPASEFFSKSVVTGNGTLQLAHSNQIRTAQLVASGSGSGGGDMSAMQNSLSNIERSLATARIIETRSKHTSAVQLSVTENRGFRIQQEKAALKLERARK